ncbi:hypothetical protein BD324DRAFT_387012 [Kockovaella imperatae]|uniref:Uncharacterized protein n=1 Tax=Kockovaella imperatae TaxID=4999 RepID=A0A1Y1UHR3_9TREE|nr:hypothetical protein BD324DRAFT_387012 [Kockovaella imperatae]ORX37600.1 hypothetical protein BD324DRAFT_387012 [Kockovaella imperatae]
MLRAIALRLGRAAGPSSLSCQRAASISHRNEPPALTRGVSLWSSEHADREHPPHLDFGFRRQSEQRGPDFGENRRHGGSAMGGSSGKARFGIRNTSEVDQGLKVEDTWIHATERGSDQPMYGRIIPPSQYRSGAFGGGASSSRDRQGRFASRRDLPPANGQPLSPISRDIHPEISVHPKTESTEFSGDQELSTQDSDPRQLLDSERQGGGTTKDGTSSPSDDSPDEFFDGFASHTAEPLNSPPPQDFAFPKSTGARPFAKYVLPQESGVAIVKQLLEEHGFLHTQEIWNKGTGGRERPIPDAFEFQPDGRIRMKRVSTLREGRRPWIPPRQPPFPDHPFRSVSFLKSTLLHSLEEQGLIHKCMEQRPFANDEEHLEAILKAESINRQREKRVMWERERHGKALDFPEPVEPPSHALVYGWRLGSENKPDEVDEKAWERAIRGERAHHEQKAREAIQAANRQLIRRVQGREAKEQRRKWRAEDAELGIALHVKREKRRLEAMESIGHYADSTGNDVSGWIQEMSQELGEVSPWRPTHLQPGGVVARKGRTAGMKPDGFPIN